MFEDNDVIYLLTVAGVVETDALVFCPSLVYCCCRQHNQNAHTIQRPRLRLRLSLSSKQRGVGGRDRTVNSSRMSLLSPAALGIKLMHGFLQIRLYECLLIIGTVLSE